MQISELSLWQHMAIYFSSTKVDVNFGRFCFSILSPVITVYPTPDSDLDASISI